MNKISLGPLKNIVKSILLVPNGKWYVCICCPEAKLLCPFLDAAKGFMSSELRAVDLHSDVNNGS